MESRLARPRAVMYGSLAVAFVIGAAWIGWWTLIPLAGAVLSYSLLRPRFATSERPEYVVAATVVIAQILIGIGLAAFAQALMHAEMQQRSDAVLDPLTGLLNRKALASRFDEIAQQPALSRCASAPASRTRCDVRVSLP